MLAKIAAEQPEKAPVVLDTAGMKAPNSNIDEGRRGRRVAPAMARIPHALGKPVVLAEGAGVLETSVQGFAQSRLLLKKATS